MSDTKFVWTVRKINGLIYYTTTVDAWGKSGPHETHCPVCRKVLSWKHFGGFMGDRPYELHIIREHDCGARLALRPS